MISAAELADMRATALAALPDTCIINRPSTGGTVTAGTGDWTPNLPTPIYNGACRLRPPDAAEIRVLAGDEQVTRERFILTIAHDAGAVAVDDTVTVTASSDPLMLVRPFRVTGHLSSSWLIARRIVVEATE